MYRMSSKITLADDMYKNITFNILHDIGSSASTQPKFLNSSIPRRWETLGSTACCDIFFYIIVH